MSGGQSHDARTQARRHYRAGQSVGGDLAGAIGIPIESDKDLAIVAVAKLCGLDRREVLAEGAGGVFKPRLPKRGEVEQTFDQNYVWKQAHGFPGEQATFGGGQEIDAAWLRQWSGHRG